jgi:hypothetical protein
MAFEEGLELVSAVAGTDLSATPMFTGVKLDANGNAVPVSAITDIPFGVLYDNAKQGNAVPVAVDGIAKCKAGATIAAGAAVAFKADGTIQTAVATQYVIGTARKSAVSGDIVPVSVDTANPWIHA